jgi:CubicO group peptidase (beta-lactamase class C family)
MEPRLMNRFIWGFVVAAFALLAASCATLGSGRVVSDPGGRFSFSVGKELTPRVEQEGFYQYRLETPGIDVYVVAAQATMEEKGVEDVLDRVGMDRAWLVLDGNTMFGEWQAMRWHLEGGDLNVALGYQARGGTVYALVATGTKEAMPDNPPSAVMRVMGSMRFTPSAGGPDRPATREALERDIERAAAARSGSISVAVIRDGTIVYRFAAGASGRDTAATPATAYHWGSMTKLVTATAVMELVEQGKIALDAPVERYLPEFPKGLGITMRRLLTHSSGLPNLEVEHLVSFRGNTLPPLDEVLASYLKVFGAQLFAPGADASYSNWNYLVLGVLVERVSGTPYADFVTGSILRPLGMVHTAFRSVDLPEGTALATPVIAAASEPGLLAHLDANRPQKDAVKLIAGRSGGLTYLVDYDILAPWGGLEGTAEDVARFLGMSMDLPPAGAEKVLAPATLASMRKVQRSTTGQALGWSLGWVLSQEKGEEVVEHGGGGPGINDLMRIYPGRRLGVVVMGNVANYGEARILSAAADIFSGTSR